MKRSLGLDGIVGGLALAQRASDGLALSIRASRNVRIMAPRVLQCWSKIVIPHCNFSRPTAVSIVLLAATLAWAQAPRSVAATIVEVQKEYANILLDAREDELSALGLKVGATFTFTHNGQMHTATLVEEYGDVESGAWLGRMWDDHVELAISFGNACTALDCKVGDVVTIMPGN